MEVTLIKKGYGATALVALNDHPRWVVVDSVKGPLLEGAEYEVLAARRIPGRKADLGISIKLLEVDTIDLEELEEIWGAE